MPAITASQTGSGPLVDRGPDLASDSKSVSSLRVYERYRLVISSLVIDWSWYQSRFSNGFAN
jgi:hypothetical protein